MDFSQWKDPLSVPISNIICNNANIPLSGVCCLDRARRDQVRNTCLCREKTGSLCFLPAWIKHTNWHSTRGSESSGLDSSEWKAAFHPISSQCWVLGVFIVIQLCHIYLSCLSYGRYLRSTARMWPSISIFIVRSKLAWFICVRADGKTAHTWRSIYHSLDVLKCWLCAACHTSHDILGEELKQLQATQRDTHPGRWCEHTALWSNHWKLDSMH